MISFMITINGFMRFAYMLYLVHRTNYTYNHRIYQVYNELPCNFKIIIKSRFDLLMSYEDYNSI